MVSCFAGYVITRSARRKAGRLAWSAIWGGIELRRQVLHRFGCPTTAEALQNCPLHFDPYFVDAKHFGNFSGLQRIILITKLLPEEMLLTLRNGTIPSDALTTDVLDQLKVELRSFVERNLELHAKRPSAVDTCMLLELLLDYFVAHAHGF